MVPTASSNECKERLALRLNLTLSHEILSLNATASFRAPTESVPPYSNPCL